MKAVHEDTILILDVNTLLWRPRITRANGCEIFIPEGVVSMYEAFKNHEDREIRAQYHRGRKQIKWKRVTIISDHIKTAAFSDERANQAIGAARYIREQYPEKRVLILTDEEDLMEVAEKYQIEACTLTEFMSEANCPARTSPKWVVSLFLLSASILILALFLFLDGSSVVFTFAFIGIFSLIIARNIQQHFASGNYIERRQPVYQPGYQEDGDDGRFRDSVPEADPADPLYWSIFPPK